MRIKDLTKSYDGKIVVDCVNFKIPKGKVLSLIGPNGAGKSTVMGIISRLIACDAGSVDFEGKPILCLCFRYNICGKHSPPDRSTSSVKH